MFLQKILPESLIKLSVEKNKVRVKKIKSEINK